MFGEGKEAIMNEPVVDDMSPTTEKLVNLLPNADKSQAELRGLADTFIKDWGKSGNVDQDGLTAHLFLALYGTILTPEQSKVLQYFRHQARIFSRLLNKTLDRVQILDQFAEGYSSRQTDPDYFQVSTLPSKLANTVLTLETSLIASRLQRELRGQGQANAVAHSYVHPQKGMPGLWVSNQGVPFDPKQLK